MDHRSVARGNFGQSKRAGALCKERITFHICDFADGSDVGHDLSSNPAHRVATELLDKEQGNRA